MTPAQQEWLKASGHKPWRPHYAVTIYQWTDVGYVFPDGRFVPEGTHHGWARPLHLMSSGDTLYVVPKDAIKVGREYMMT